MSVGFTGLSRFVAGPAMAADHGPGKYGPLLKDPAGILNLPKGFRYRVISRQGEKMADGLLVPGKPDGMATFPLDRNRILIVRNHECNANAPEDGAFGPKYELLSNVAKEQLYDFGRGQSPCAGGTTTLVYNMTSGKVEKQFLSLAGTLRNCAGGPTPWGSWLTCEETVVKADRVLEKNHGYVFEVVASDRIALANPLPIKAMGRFNHEAVAVDPVSQVVYLTEDDSESLLYRFLPNSPGKLHEGGKLQALCLADERQADTRNWKGQHITPGQDLAAIWIDLDDIDAPDNDLRLRGHARGAARFARGEGMWYGNNQIYFACTNGGRNKLGQVFSYTPSPAEGTEAEKSKPGMLRLFAEPNNSELFKSCDNLTVAPSGDVVLCEDDGHPFVVGITPAGEYFRIAENVGYQSEFAGGVFSPDGSTYFVNIQHAGLTVAIEGPWG